MICVEHQVNVSMDAVVADVPYVKREGQYANMTEFVLDAETVKDVITASVVNAKSIVRYMVVVLCVSTESVEVGVMIVEVPNGVSIAVIVNGV